MDDHSLDVVGLRSRFASLGSRPGDAGAPVFMDGPGGTQVPDEVSTAVSQYFLRDNSNIEGEFPLTQRTDALIARARHYGGEFVGGDWRGIVFGQNMTTLNFNLARAVGRTMQPGDEIITTALDHEGNVSPWLLLAEDRDFTVHTVGLTGELAIDLDQLRSKLSNRTKVVAFSLASNAVGSISAVREIVDLAHSVGALAWADAVAYAPHRRIDVDALGCDVLLCSPYKFFGPHSGMAWLRPDLASIWPAERVRPAGSEPPGHRFETGTLAHEALAGFVAAVDYLASLGRGADLAERLDSAYAAIQRHEVALAERFLAGIAAMPHISLVGPPTADPASRVGTFGLIVDGRSPAECARILGERGVYTWNGNFYAQGVMEHLGVDLEEGILRIGVVHYNTDDDVDRTLAELARLAPASIRGEA